MTVIDIHQQTSFSLLLE